MRRYQGIDPVTERERVELLDILRGFALIGMLVSHLASRRGELFSFPPADRVVESVLGLLVEDSFAPLFAFLFGHGFAIQLLRAAARGVPIAGLYLRRLLALLLIGTVHAVLITDGDILVPYALVGVLLLACHRLSPRLLLAGILILFTVQVGEQPLRRAAAWWRDIPAAEWEGIERIREVRRVQARQEWALRGTPTAAAASYAEDVRRRWDLYTDTLRHHTDWRQLPFSSTLLLFLIGLYAGRRRWLLDAARYRTGFRLTLLLAGCLSLGGAAVVAQTGGGGSAITAKLAEQAANLGVAACYVGAVTLAVTGSGRVSRALHGLAPVGMMALSTYFIQSLATSWPFLPYGLDLPEPDAAASLVLALAFFFLVQVPLARWWMGRFRFGPAEWFWRSLTYIRVQSLRRPATRSPVRS